MKIFVSLLFLAASIGVLNGFIAGIILLLKKGAMYRKMLGALLIALSIRIGKSVFFYFVEDVDKLILQVGLSACVFIGPFFYAYIKTKLGKTRNHFSRNVLMGFSTLFIATLIVGIVYPYRAEPEIWNGIIVKVIYFIWGSFTILGLIASRNHIRSIYRTQGMSGLANDETTIVSAAMAFITTTYMCALFISGFTYIWGAIAFTIFFYYMMILLLLGRREMTVRKYSSEPLSEGKALLIKVNDIMSQNQLFLSPKLKLDELAAIVKMDRNTLSRLLNEVHGGGFARYVNEFRVNEAKRLIRERHELSLEGIGYEAGFNSKSSFFATFKSIAGLTPAAFKNSLQDETIPK